MIALCAILALAHIADMATTRLALKAGAVEANPIARWFKARMGGWTWMVAIKAPVIALQWWALWAYWPQDWIIALTCVLVVVHAAVAAHNYRVAK